MRLPCGGLLLTAGDKLAVACAVVCDGHVPSDHATTRAAPSASTLLRVLDVPLIGALLTVSGFPPYCEVMFHPPWVTNHFLRFDRDRLIHLA